MKVFCAGFFFSSSLPHLCAWNQGQNQSDDPQVIIASPSQWDATNPQTNWQLHSWHPLFHPSPPAPQHRSSLLDLQSHENSTSTKDPLLCFLPGALGVRQQLQTCRKMMAGRIGKLWLLCNKLKHYTYVTAIWEREALLVMTWIRDRKKGK